MFVISLAALERSPGSRSILLSLALGLFSLKNIVVTYFYLADDMPDIHPFMFADVLVTGAILLRLLITGTVDSIEGEEEVGKVENQEGTSKNSDDNNVGREGLGRDDGSERSEPNGDAEGLQLINDSKVLKKNDDGEGSELRSNEKEFEPVSEGSSQMTPEEPPGV